MRVFIEYKRKGATTVYILQIFFPVAHQQKHPLPILLFFFSFNKRSQVRVWDKEKEFRVSKSKNLSFVSVVVVKKCLRDLSLHFEKKRRTKSEHPRFLSRPPTRSTPFLTAETLVRRDSSNSFLLLLLLFCARREESLVVLFKVVVSGVEGVSLCVGSD